MEHESQEVRTKYLREKSERYEAEVHFCCDELLWDPEGKIDRYGEASLWERVDEDHFLLVFQRVQEHLEIDDAPVIDSRRKSRDFK